jgi:hypothetical protein
VERELQEASSNVYLGGQELQNREQQGARSGAERCASRALPTRPYILG